MKLQTPDGSLSGKCGSALETALHACHRPADGASPLAPLQCEGAGPLQRT
jgi:hypothetical protein